MTNQSPDPNGISPAQAPEGKAPMSTSKVAIITAGCVAGLAVVVFGGVAAKDYLARKTVDYAVGELVGAGQETRTETVLDPDTLTADQFYNQSNISEAQRIEWCKPIIEARTPQAIEDIGVALSRSNRQPLMSLSQPSIDNTAQEIMTQHTVASWIASNTSTMDEGKKLLSCVVSPDASTFGGALSQIGNKKVLY